jgi:tripartite-type tricarboxylate transporter receptor subunit TctC
MRTAKLLVVFVFPIICHGLLTPYGYAQETYPTRPIRILVPFPAGGAADTIGRTIGQQLTAQLGQSAVVDNRPGAAGRLATEMLARAEPNGYTLLVGTPGAISVAPSLYETLPYDPERDLMPVTLVAEALNVLVVNPSTGANSVEEFIAWAKRAKEVRFGSSGVGQTDHLAAELFKRLTGVRMDHVPYKGGGPALVDLLAGDLHVMFPTYVVAAPHLKSGKLRALGIATADRKELVPDLPAISESVPGFGISNWDGIFVPARTPSRIADRLFVEITRAIKHPELIKRQNAAGLVPIVSASRADFARFIQEDKARWAQLIKEAKIRID